MSDNKRNNAPASRSAKASIEELNAKRRSSNSKLGNHKEEGSNKNNNNNGASSYSGTTQNPANCPNRLVLKVLPSGLVVPKRRLKKGNNLDDPLSNQNGAVTTNTLVGPPRTESQVQLLNSVSDKNAGNNIYPSGSDENLNDVPEDFFKEIKSSLFRVVPSWEEAIVHIENVLESSGNKTREAGSLTNVNNSGNAKSGTGNTNLTNSNSNLTFITIPFGFQNIRTLSMQHPTLKLATYNPSHDVFLGIDSHSTTLWQGSSKIQRFEDTFGINKIAFINEFHVYLASTTDMHLNVYDPNLNLVWSSSISKPVVSFEFVPAHEEIIAGSIGSIMVWQFCADSRNSVCLNLKLTINLPNVDQWVSDTFYDVIGGRIIAAVDQSIYMYNYNTGKMVAKQDNLHETTITCCILYYPFDYFVTAGKDGNIRCWTRNFVLIHEFVEHHGPVSSMFALEKHFGPCLVTASVDKTIRMFNLETFTCVYRLDVASEILEMKFIKDEYFYTMAKQGITVWYLNKYQNTFNMTRSPVLKVKLCTHPKRPSRFLTLCEDGSVRLINQYLGQTLVIAMPLFKDHTIIDAIYDAESEKIYAFSNMGDVIVYDSEYNPCRVENVNQFEGNTCFTSVELYNNVKFIKARERRDDDGDDDFGSTEKIDIPEETLWIFAGSSDGQLLMLNKVDLKWRIIQQAHTAGVVQICGDHTRLRLYSGGNDRMLKIWQIVYERGVFGMQFHLEVLYSVTLNHNPIHLDVCRNMAGFVSGQTQVTFFDEDFENFRNHSLDEDHTRSVTGIGSNYTLRLFVTCGIDGLIKVWDQNNCLLREVQFDEPVLSVCFANEKGDLLVGLSNQIAVVRCYDYLPYTYLKFLLQLAPYFKDKPVLQDKPKVFDAEYAYWEESIEKGEVEGADDELQKLIDMLKNAEKGKSNGEDLMDPFRVALLKLKIRKKMNGKVKVQNKAGVAITADEVEADPWFEKVIKEGMTITPQNVLPPSELLQYNYFQEGKEDADDLKPLIVEKIYKKKKEERDRKLKAKRDGKKGNGLRDRNSVSESGSKLSVDGEISKPGQNMEISRADITSALKRRKQKDGSNSNDQKDENDDNDMFSEERNRRIIYEDTDDEVEKEKMKAAQTILRLTSKQILQMNNELGSGPIDPETVKKMLQDKEALKEYVNKIAKAGDEAKRHRGTGKQFIPKGLAMPNSVAVINLQARGGSDSPFDADSKKPGEAKNIIEAFKSEKAVKQRNALREMRNKKDGLDWDALFDIEDDESGEEQEETSALADANAATGAASESKKTEAEQASKKADEAPKPEAATTVAKPESGDAAVPSSPVKSKTKSSAASKRSIHSRSTSSKSKNPYPNLLPESLDQLTSLGSDLIGSKRTALGAKGVKGRRKKAGSSKTNSKVVYAKEDKQVIMSEHNNFVLPENEEVSAKVENAITWEILRNPFPHKMEDGKMPEEFKKIVNLFWFPGLGNRETNLTNIVEVLMQVLNEGGWSEKVEASKTLLYLFNIFKQDFPNILNDFIYPQLNSLYDESWQVRAHTCLTMARYNIKDTHIISALISRLGDSNETVRINAKAALAHFGIDNRDALEEEMAKIGYLEKVAETIITDEEKCINAIKKIRSKNMKDNNISHTVMIQGTSAIPPRDLDRNYQVKLWLAEVRKILQADLAMSKLAAKRKKKAKEALAKQKQLAPGAASRMRKKGARINGALGTINDLGEEGDQLIGNDKNFDPFNSGTLPQINESGQVMLLSPSAFGSAAAGTTRRSMTKTLSSCQYISGKEKSYLRKALWRREWFKLVPS